MTAPILGLDPTKVWASTEIPGFSLGDVVGYDDPVDGYKEYVFGQVEANAQAVGNVMVEGPASVWTRISTTNAAAGQLGGHGSRVGVCAGAPLASGYGWMQIYGKCSALTAGAVAVGTRLNVTPTVGAVDDDGTATRQAINGMVFKTAVGGAQVGTDCRLSYPTTGITL